MKNICCVIVLMVLMVLSMVGMAFSIELNNVRVGFHTGFRRLVFDLTAKPVWNVKTKGNVTVVMLKKTSVSKIKPYRVFSDKILKSYRVIREKEGIRIEVRTRQTVIAKVLEVPNPFRLVVDLYPYRVTKKEKEVKKVETVQPIKTPSTGTTIARVNVVNLPLLPTDEDIWDRKIFNTFLFYFSVDPAWTIRKGSFLSIVISHSELSLNRISSLTVYLNGLPLKSIFLDKSNAMKTTLRIPIPVNYLKKGYNEVAVKAYLRSLADPCQDVDNPGNWLKIHHESIVHLEYVLKKDLMLSDYPVPFFEPLLPRYFNTVIVVPDNPSGKELSAAFAIIMDWAQNATYGGFFPIVARESELRKIDKERNMVYIGRFSSFGRGFRDYISRQIRLKLQKGKGYIAMLPSLFDKEKMLLLVTALDDLDVIRAAKALIIPEVREQMNGKVAVIDRGVVLPMKSRYRKMGDFITLTELGYPNIMLEGMYHQEKVVTYRVPTNWKLKQGAYAKIYFRHSKLLSPDRSSLTIELNDVPITSVKLTKENADNGVVTVKLPGELLEGGFLNFGFKAYLDINTKDCAKNYVEDAWVLIKGISVFYLPHKILPAKFLIEYLPYLYMQENGLKDTEVIFTDKPDRTLLTIFANILASWQDKITIPEPPKVLTVENDKLSVFKNKTKMMIVGRPKEYLSKIFHGLIKYNRAKKRFYSEKYPLVPEFVKRSVAIQVIDNGGYPLTWVVVPEQFEVRAPFLLSLSMWSSVNLPQGELSLISENGKVVSFVEKRKEIKQESKSGFISKALEVASERKMLTTLLIFLVSAAVIVLVLIRKERKR